jgi:hypothetical protein
MARDGKLEKKKDGEIACIAQEVFFFKKNIFFYLCQESNRCWWAGRTPMIGIANQSTEAIQAIRCIDQLKVSQISSWSCCYIYY